MIKVKLGVLQTAKPVLEKLLKFDLPFVAARALGQSIKVISEELVLLNEHRVKLVKEYGKEDEKKNYNVLPEKLEGFYKAYGDVLDTEVELNISPIPAKFLEHPNVLLSTVEYFQIEKLLSE